VFDLFSTHALFTISRNQWGGGGGPQGLYRKVEKNAVYSQLQPNDWIQHFCFKQINNILFIMCSKLLPTARRGSSLNYSPPTNLQN
jgi:hypothetical protein